MYFHCFTASTAARAKRGSPLTIFTAEISPALGDGCQQAQPCLRCASASRLPDMPAASSSPTVLATLPARRSASRSTGAGALLSPPMRLGSDPPLSAVAIPVMLGACASVIGAGFATGFCERSFLITMAGAAAFVAGALSGRRSRSLGRVRFRVDSCSDELVHSPHLRRLTYRNRNRKSSWLPRWIVERLRSLKSRTELTKSQKRSQKSSQGSGSRSRAGRHLRNHGRCLHRRDATCVERSCGPARTYPLHPYCGAAGRNEHNRSHGQQRLLAAAGGGLPPLLTLPPKVNAGAGADVPSLEEVFSLKSATFSASLGSEIAAEGLVSVATLCFGSRAGAGALAAPDPNPAELAVRKSKARPRRQNLRLGGCYLCLDLCLGLCDRR